MCDMLMKSLESNYAVLYIITYIMHFCVSSVVTL